MYKFNLQRSFFSDRPLTVLESDSMSAELFKYSTGIEGVTIKNKRGYVTLLPYQGQQIWRLEMDGHNMVMKSSFDEPRRPDHYLATYGGQLLHCGMTAFGVPGPADTHPLHGETPNAPFDTAALLSGKDEKGEYIALTGTWRYVRAFGVNYVFTPECRLYEKATTVEITVNVENLRSKPQEFMYLCHINWRPVDGAKLVATLKYDKEHIKVHRRWPEDMDPETKAKLIKYMDELEKDPSIMNDIGAEGQCYDPEICFALKYEADEKGYAHTMQVLPDGYACYVKHPVKSLPVGVRWISRIKDEDACGMVLPATSEHLGYTDSKAKGYIRYIPAYGTEHFSFRAGILPPAEEKEVEKKIEKVMG